jgi:hypothetical protein
MVARKKRAIFLIIILLLLIGFLKGYNEKAISGCTEMWCNPTLEVGTERISCNSCFIEDPLFSLGFLKLLKTCNGREYLIFNDGDYIDREVEVDFASCKYSFS